jgi:hypothetical protein
VFSTKENSPPNTPSNPNPPNGATNVSITTDLSWTGGDPDSGDNVTYDVYFGSTSPPPIIVHNQSVSQCSPGTLLYQHVYYWRIVAWDNHNTSAAGPLWSFTTEHQPDVTPPFVEITQPQQRYLYILFAGFILIKIRFFTTFIIGKIDVNVNAVDNQSGMDRVEFYLDDKLQGTDTIAPYSWEWTAKGFFFPYILKVIAFDKAGNQQSKEMKVWKLF